MNILTAINNRFGLLSNKNTYKYLLILDIVFCSVISYKNITFDLYFNSVYREYGDFFRDFDFSVFSHQGLTFPMWGYGIVHLFHLNKLHVLILQQFFSLFVLLKLDSFLEKNKILINIKFFRFLILVSTPWFFIHTQMWPRSIVANLFLISVVYIFEYIISEKERYLLYSAILLGIMHNFRPDYLYLSIILFFALILYRRKQISLKLIVFPAIQYVLLIPWMAFTYHQTGKFIPTSTNAGHVLFIGLGQLPNNNWGITPFDEDPIKIKVLTKKFGPVFKSDDFKEDAFLKKKYFEYVKRDPTEYLKKCLFSTRLLFFDPFYVGNVGNFQQNKISNVKEIRELETLAYQLKIEEFFNLIKVTNWKFSLKEIFQLVITIYTKLIGIILFSFFVFITMLSIVKLKFSEFFKPIPLILILIIFYQISISIFAFHMPVYNSVSYVFYLLISYLLFQKYLSIKQ